MGARVTAHSTFDPLRGTEVGCAAPRACSTCPWRLDVQENPPEDAARLEGDEGVRTRWRLWEGGVHTIDAHLQGRRKGIKDGNAIVCHQTDALFNANRGVKPDAKPILCVSTIALRQRCVLRWCFGGSREPLTFDGALATVAEMVGVAPEAIDTAAGWIVDGVKIKPSRLVELAHIPLVFDANIACEGVPAPTDEEIALWRGFPVAA